MNTSGPTFQIMASLPTSNNRTKARRALPKVESLQVFEKQPEILPKICKTADGTVMFWCDFKSVRGPEKKSQRVSGRMLGAKVRPSCRHGYESLVPGHAVRGNTPTGWTLSPKPAAFLRREGQSMLGPAGSPDLRNTRHRASVAASMAFELFTRGQLK